MKINWESLVVNDEGQVLNVNAHDAIAEVISFIKPNSVCIAWRSPEGDLKVVRTQPGSNAIVFASGLMLPSIISGVYLRPEAGQWSPCQTDSQLAVLRERARKCFKSPDWFLEFEVSYGDPFLVAVEGTSEIFQTASISDLGEMFLD